MFKGLTIQQFKKSFPTNDTSKIDGKIEIVLGNFILAPTMMKLKADWKK